VGPSWRRLAVGPTPPADWGTRSTRSHLGKCPEHEILIFADRGVGPGVGPVQGQVSPKGAGGQGGLGSSRFLAGFRSAALAGAAGARRSAARARAKSRLRSFLVLDRTSSTQCGYFLLFPMREEPRGYRSSQRLRPADRVWRPLPCPCPCVANIVAACSLSTELSPIGGKNRCTRRPTWPLRGGIWEQNCGLWQLAITD
jgi:hypothetical protein